MKKGFIIMLLVSAVVLTGCGAKNEGAKTECFDFTETEIVSELESCLIDFVQMAVVDDKDKNIVSYISTDDVFTTDNEEVYASMHYSIVCNKTTDEVQSISYFIDKNSTKAAERFFYHLFSIASSIDPNADSDTMADAIESDNGDVDGLYFGNNFTVSAYCIGDDYHAYFTPTKDTKGE